MAADDRLGAPVINDTRAVSLPTRTTLELDELGQPFDRWQNGVRCSVLANVADFIAARPAAELHATGIDALAEALATFVSGGKCLRSTLMYLGWLCGAMPDESALRAASSMELLHAFALLQDDVMDNSAMRRGRPAVHVQFARWHRARGSSGSSRRFGESIAVLLGDMCLIWADQMLSESGLDPSRLQRARPHYDAMRVELAVGQFADLAGDVRHVPPLETALQVARLKSGNYTVRRPLEIGAMLAGCDERTVTELGRYGNLVGEAFQLRDDLLGAFSGPATTGKPDGGDLLERKPTIVVVAAYHFADGPIRRELAELMQRADLDDAAIAQWRSLIRASGAVKWAESRIADSVTAAQRGLHDMAVDEFVRSALANMAVACTGRVA